MTQKDWLKEEIKAYRNYDVAAKSDREIAKLYPGLKASLRHKKAHRLYLEGKYFLARKYADKTRQTRIITNEVESLDMINKKPPFQKSMACCTLTTDHALSFFVICFLLLLYEIAVTVSMGCFS